MQEAKAAIVYIRPAIRPEKHLLQSMDAKVFRVPFVVCGAPAAGCVPLRGPQLRCFCRARLDRCPPSLWLSRGEPSFAFSKKLTRENGTKKRGWNKEAMRKVVGALPKRL
jgi:hypothetical protein